MSRDFPIKKYTKNVKEIIIHEPHTAYVTAWLLCKIVYFVHILSHFYNRLYSEFNVELIEKVQKTRQTYQY